MGEYVKNKKDMKFQSQDALKTVQSVIDDADKALHDKSRKMKDSPIGEAVAGAVVLGGAGVGIASHVKNKRLREAKELIYKNAIAKQTAILKALKDERDADKERIDYLNGLNILLQSAINDLKHDLGIA